MTESRKGHRAAGRVRHSSFNIPSSFVIRASSFLLMVLFIILCPIVAAFSIMIGAPAA